MRPVRGCAPLDSTPGPRLDRASVLHSILNVKPHLTYTIACNSLRREVWGHPCTSRAPSGFELRVVLQRNRAGNQTTNRLPPPHEYTSTRSESRRLPPRRRRETR